MEIKNMSECAHRYEFIVAFTYEGETWYWGAYRYIWDAKAAARQCGGFIIHNLRISGYKEN